MKCTRSLLFFVGLLLGGWSLAGRGATSAVQGGSTPPPKFETGSEGTPLTGGRPKVAGARVGEGSGG